MIGYYKETPLPAPALPFEPLDLSAALDAIEGAAQSAEAEMEQAADDHARAFSFQMRELVGVERLESEDEPYLESDVAEATVDYLRGIQRILDILERMVNAKAIRPDDPILPQVERELELLSLRVRIELKQTLDSHRQQNAGIRQYIWVTAGDDRVRPSHQARDGGTFTWGEGEEPGQAANCRCSASPVLEGAENESVFDPAAEFEVAGYGAIIRIIATKIAQNSDKIRHTVSRMLPRTRVRGNKPPARGRTDTAWKYGRHKSEAKWKNQMTKRGWTEEEITEAIKHGDEYPAINHETGNQATRYVHPRTGRSVVRDNTTKEILQVGGDGFRY